MFVCTYVGGVCVRVCMRVCVCVCVCTYVDSMCSVDGVDTVITR